MGINGLSAYLRKLNEDIFVTVPLASFFGERIAIDASVFLYKYKCTDAQLKGNWYDRFIQLIATLWRVNIRPVFIFDGTPPIDKLEVQTKRRTIRACTQMRIDSLNECVEEEIVNKDKAAEYFRDECVRTESDLNIKIRIHEHGKKLASQCIYILPEDLTLLKNLLTMLGIPWYMANGEAERTCAWLAVNGHVKAVLTTDSDAIAYGAPIFINDIRDTECKMVAYDDVIELLSLTSEQFLDFCIMCGTDYNKRIRGIGPVNIHALLTLWGSTEAIPDFDLDSLKYHRTRELFTLPNNASDVLQNIRENFYIKRVKNIDFFNLELFLIKYNSIYTLEHIRSFVYKPTFVKK